MGNNSQKYASVHTDNYFINSRQGNFTDDLARNAVDLDGLKQESHYNKDFPSTLEFVRCVGNDICWNIVLKNADDGQTYSFEDIVEIYQKLGQMIATARRKEQENKK